MFFDGLSDFEKGAVFCAMDSVGKSNDMRPSVKLMLKYYKNGHFDKEGFLKKVRPIVPYASDEEIRLAAEIAQADDFVRERNDSYESVLGQGGSGVSGGQRQRLTIARSLLKKPKILILDNSTSAVDTKTETAIMEGIDQNLKDLTKIIISQRVSSFKYADRIIVMEEGKISDIGTHDELYERNKNYRQTYDIQQQGGNDND